SVLHELAYNAVSASNISPAALFRVIEQVRPTLLIDEADTFLPGNDQLRGILNAGYKKKTAYVWRAVNESTSSLSETLSATLSPGAWFRSYPAIENRHSKIENLKSGLRHFSTWCPKAIAQIGRLPDTLADRCILIHMSKKPGSQRC